MGVSAGVRMTESRCVLFFKQKTAYEMRISDWSFRRVLFRSCKRCLPDDVARDESAVIKAIAAIKQSEEPLALADLAGRTGYSPTHFQRVFTRHTGLSPAAYARALREERARAALSEAGRVDRKSTRLNSSH